MKRKSIHVTLLTLAVLAGLASTIGCIVQPIGPGYRERGAGDRYEDRGRRDGGRERDRDHHEGDRPLDDRYEGERR